MSDFRIVGIMLVRNEDVFIEQSIRNVLDFCDWLIITDHQSTDSTFEICKRLASENSKIDLRQINHVSESAEAITPYYNTPTWIFAVDGDEVYDPVGLSLMREKLLAGEFSNSWAVFGNVLNVSVLDAERRKAKGYLAPPARTITKLYNFSAIDDWLDCTVERLHGDKIVFKPGFSVRSRRYLHQEIDWDYAYFRCLHLAFLNRSSNGRENLMNIRLNPDEIHQINATMSVFGRSIKSLRFCLRQLLRRDWKNTKYRRGPLVEKDVRVFFSL